MPVTLREELPTRYAAAIEAYRTMRRRTLALYPGVLDTLRAVRAAGALVVAYTESRAYYADYRVRTLGLDGALDYLYSLPDHALPEGMTPSQIRRYPPEHYRLRTTVHRHTREGAWKPDASVLLEILRDVGAEPGRAVYVGDSLVKDVAMAQAAVGRRTSSPDTATSGAVRATPCCAGSPTGRPR